jgi:hypothetical protein
MTIRAHDRSLYPRKPGYYELRTPAGAVLAELYAVPYEKEPSRMRYSVRNIEGDHPEATWEPKENPHERRRPWK